MKKKVEPELLKPVEEGRLLIITSFEKTIKQVTRETAEKRNRFMIEIADEIVTGHASKGGMLERLIAEVKEKKVTFIE